MPKAKTTKRLRKRNNPMPRNKSRMRATQNSSSVPAGISQAGLNFIKCAFAPPDFATDPGMGIPDQYDGKTLMRKDQLSSSISMTAGDDIFIIHAPIPGVSYFFTVTLGGTYPTAASQWTPVYYPGYFNGGLAGPSTGWSGDNVTSFRFASSCIGVYPTSNMMNSSGAVQVWKANLKLVIANRTLDSPQYTVEGLESVQVVGPENFTGKFLDGCYSVATSNQPDFEFTPLVVGLNTVPNAGVTQTSVNQFGILEGTVGGIGNMETTIIRLTAPVGSINSLVLKTWNCIEYTVNPNSALYMYSSVSAPYDPVALAYYHKIKKNLPIAVTAAQNAGFWDRVKSIMQTVTKSFSYIPGPVGLISKGVNQLLT